MAQYKLRQRSGAKQPEISKRGGGFNIVVVVICALLSVLIWFYAIGTAKQNEVPQVGADEAVTESGESGAVTTAVGTEP